jgi:hypothetical protein
MMVMAAKSKSKLLEVTESEFGKLMKLVDSIDAAIALKKRDQDTSIKDVIAQRAHWIDLFLAWHADSLAGKPVCYSRTCVMSLRPQSRPLCKPRRRSGFRP